MYAVEVEVCSTVVVMTVVDVPEPRVYVRVLLLTVTWVATALTTGVSAAEEATAPVPRATGVTVAAASAWLAEEAGEAAPVERGMPVGVTVTEPILVAVAR